MQSHDILKNILLKSANFSNHCEELIKATIPELQYDLMKDQLKKIFSGASRHVPTKNEEVIMPADMFTTKAFSPMIQHKYSADKVIVE